MEHFESKAVQDIKQGEYVRRINKDGTMQSKTYTRAEYDQSSKRYCLNDCDDMNRCIYVKRDTMLAIGFTY